MKGTLSNVLIFAAGAAIGSAVTWAFVKSKYEQLVQEEIESVKESFATMSPESEADPETPNQPEPTVDRVPTKPDLKEYARQLERYRSDIREEDESYNADVNEEDDEEDEAIPTVYVINPDVFGEDDYETEFLTLYADNVLADDSDNPVTDVVGRVGKDFMNHFGTYEEDLVCVRNEELHTDFEISRDSRKYEEMYSSPNHHKGDTE